jgi:hypothetical protein
MRRIIIFISLICSSALALDSGVSKTMDSEIAAIKKETTYDGKNNRLKELLSMINKEFGDHSKILTELQIKIQENPYDQVLLAEKDKNQLIYEDWTVFKVVFTPLNKLFVSKTDSYHCESISDDIWQDYAPTAPVEKKVELDSFTKKAIENAIDLAKDICKVAPLTSY